MANAQGVAISFKTEIQNGIHALGTSVVRAATTPDAFKAALYVTTATMDNTATVYTAVNEVFGAGYVAGGVALTGAQSWIAPSSSGSTAFSTPTANIIFATVTLTTAFDAVLIYNSTQGNKAVGVWVFGAQTITAGTLTLVVPANVVGTALLRIT